MSPVITFEIVGEEAEQYVIDWAMRWGCENPDASVDEAVNFIIDRFHEMGREAVKEYRLSVRHEIAEAEVMAELDGVELEK